MARLVPCRSCARHIRETALACPFCATVATHVGSSPPPVAWVPTASTRRSRAGMLALSASLAAAACAEAIPPRDGTASAPPAAGAPSSVPAAAASIASSPTPHDAPADAGPPGRAAAARAADAQVGAAQAHPRARDAAAPRTPVPPADDDSFAPVYGGPPDDEAQDDHPPFDRAAAAAALNGVDVASCAAADGHGPRGDGHVSITFANTGRVRRARVDQPPFAGTPVGKCVETAFGRMSVPPYAGADVTIGNKFSIK